MPVTSSARIEEEQQVQLTLRASLLRHLHQDLVDPASLLDEMIQAVRHSLTCLFNNS